jgi:alpha-mannosidase
MEKKLFMIGNAHIDPAWLWEWQDGFHEVKATFRSALDRMKEYPDFVFVSSAAATYEWVEQNDPQMFAEIQQAVAAGRWKLVGGWWIEPDCNIPAGESFARQGLYGQRYFLSKFGITAQTGYNVDSFGHNGMLPQILKKSGLKQYVFMRPSPHEKGLPGRLFWWEADDGSRVLTFQVPYEYCTWGSDLTQNVMRVAAELNDPFNQSMCFYGVGNHGGGPTRENLDSIQRLKGTPGLPDLLLSSPDEFFQAVLSQGSSLPVVHDDLQHHSSGCYAAHSGVKRWNRQAENRLLAAEKFSTIADWQLGLQYPAEFCRAWKNVLFNQFHDIMAGTCIEPAYDAARDQFGEALSIGARTLNNAVQALAWNVRIDPEEGQKPFVVFNPNVWESKVNVEVESTELKPGEVLLDDQDCPVPLQTVQSAATAQGRNRLTFTADLPALGYRTYRVVSRPNPASFPNVAATDTSLENERFRLEFNPQTGYISSLQDKKAGVEVFAGPAAVPVIIDDPSDTWSHNVFRFDHVAGTMKLRSMRLVEQGPVKAVLRVTHEFWTPLTPDFEGEIYRSLLVQDFTMYADLDQIDVAVKVDWNEKFKMLKLRFPLNLNAMRSTYEIPYGHIVREAYGDEEPGQSWVDLSGLSRDNGAMYGFSLLNDGKYSFDVNVRDLGMTVLRSPVYANHMPVVPDPQGEYSFMDQGVQRFLYSMVPHTGSWVDAGTVRRAAELNQRPVVLAGTCHPGSLPQNKSFMQVKPANLVVSALKKAEDNDDMVVRCYETAGTATTGVIEMPDFNRRIEVRFGPCEIKTFRVPRDHSLPVVEVNILEMQETESKQEVLPPAEEQSAG